jgi:hypothetical protein
LNNTHLHAMVESLPLSGVFPRSSCRNKILLRLTVD